jgi:diguanylate cyclase (GGDEF)-like protein
MLGRHRPPAVTTLVAMYGGGAFLGVLGAIFPISADMPVELDLGTCSIALVVAVAVWIAGERTPEWVLKAGVALAVVMVGLIVSQSATPQGVMLIAFTYVWMVIYTAVFFSRRMVVAIAALIAVTFGAGIVLMGMPKPFTVWLVVVVTVSVAGLTLNLQSLRQREMAITDPLTGLLNRHGLRLAATRELAISGRTGRSLTIAVLDLDGFKAINDRHGHIVGDRVLADVAERWKATLRAGDILARTGGDEFVLMLPATDERDALPLLDRLRDSAAIAWSVGTTSVSPGEDFYVCLARADRALYTEKNRRPARAATIPALVGEVATVEV